MTHDLVIHGPHATRAQADQLADRLGAQTVVERPAGAFRIRSVDPMQPGSNELATLARFCAEARIDFGFVPSGRRLADFGLVAMDMDSTLITIECIDELADLVGRKPEVAAVTAAAMRGELDWPASLRQRVAVLAGIEAAALETLYRERVRLSPGAETMLVAVQSHGLHTLLVSGGFTFFTERLRTRLRLDRAHSNVLDIADGRLTGRVDPPLVDAAEKARLVSGYARELGLSREQVVVMGDGANDLPMMAEAGVSIAFRAKPAVRARATYCFDHAGLDGLLALFPAA